MLGAGQRGGVAAAVLRVGRAVLRVGRAGLPAGGRGGGGAHPPLEAGAVHLGRRGGVARGGVGVGPLPPHSGGKHMDVQ